MTSEHKELEPEEGGPCLFAFCEGKLEHEQEPCYCSAVRMPPCSACTSAYLRCAECKRRTYEDGTYD